MDSINAIIFDKDGTLFDFHATWGVWAGGFLDRLALGDEALYHVLADAVGYDTATGRFHPQSMIVAGTPADIADALMPYLDDRFSPSTLTAHLDSEAAKAEQVGPVPLVPYFSALSRRGLRLGIATNDAEAPAREHLRAAGVLGFFDFVAGYDSGFGAKPGPGQLQGFCQQVDVQPNHSLMVGDSLHDILAGRAAGFRTVGVLTGLATRADLAPMADAVLPDIGHLPAWLDAAP